MSLPELSLGALAEQLREGPRWDRATVSDEHTARRWLDLLAQAQVGVPHLLRWSPELDLGPGLVPPGHVVLRDRAALEAHTRRIALEVPRWLVGPGGSLERLDPLPEPPMPLLSLVCLDGPRCPVCKGEGVRP